MTTKKNKIQIPLWLLTAMAVFSLYLISCSPGKEIEKNEFKGYSDINLGDTATIDWNFRNAEKVIVENFPGIYSKKDSIKVSPDKSRKYVVKAIQGVDTLEMAWRVYIKKPENAIEAESGKTARIQGTNYDNTEYFSGIIKSGDIIPSKVKITRIEYPDRGEDLVTLRAEVLDNFGNFISGLNNKEVLWSLLHTCTMGLIGEPIEKFRLINKLSDTNFIDIAVALDNSAPAEDNYISLGYINDFTKSLQNFDNFSFSYFNQSVITPVPLTAQQILGDQVKNLTLPEPQGLSAIYKASYTNIDQLGSLISGNPKILVVITFAPDNASILYTSKDISEIARKMNIPIYVISVGNAIDSYSLKYISSITGGRFYNIPVSDVSQIDDILKEIVYSQFLYYEFDIPVKAFNASGCDIIKSEITFNYEDVALSDNLRIDFNPDQRYTRYQALAIFDYKESFIKQDYYPAIISLAETLKDNPNQMIQLIGHSSAEGNYDDNIKFSLDRAKEVKKLISSQGIDPERIRLKAEGSSKPLFYLQQSEWQQTYNRRVELKWLDPALQPFEIIAEVVSSEEEASEKVDSWLKRGYKSYFERYLKENNPVYLVKLWGYSTEAQAKTEIDRLKKNYNLSFVLE